MWGGARTRVGHLGVAGLAGVDVPLGRLAGDLLEDVGVGGVPADDPED